MRPLFIKVKIYISKIERKKYIRNDDTNNYVGLTK